MKLENIRKIRSMGNTKNMNSKITGKIGSMENWKYEKLKKYEIGNMENLENVKEDNRNKRRSIIEGGGGANVKTRKGIQWNKHYYKLYNYIIFLINY